MKRNSAILILVFMGFTIYFNSLFNSFVWDDEEQVVKNVLVHSITNIPAFFIGSTFNSGGSGSLAGIYYKPMMNVFYSVIYTLFGEWAFFFHLFQVTLHITNAIVLLLIFNKLLKKTNLSLFLALIFLVHPINFEAAGYIAAFQDVLFFFFGIMALFFLSKGSNKMLTNILIYVLLFLSLLSKETGIIFFLIAFYYLLIFRKNNLFSYLTFHLISIAFYFILRFGVAGVFLSKTGVTPIMHMTFFTRLSNIPLIILFYLKTFFWPLNLAISQNWIIKSINLANFYLPLLITILFFSLIIIYYKVTKDKIFLFFFLWFISGLVIHLQLFPLDMTVADRWFYLPMAGLLGMIGVVINNLLFGCSIVFNNNAAMKQLSRYRWKLKQVVVAFTIVIVLFLSLRTFFRSFDWRNGLTLFEKDIKIAKISFDLENNLGVELYRVGRSEAAKIHFENSIKFAPDWWTNWNNLGAYYEGKKDYQRAENYYKNAIENGDYYLAYENYAWILIKQKKMKEAREFVENKAILKFPYNQKLKNAYDYLASLKN